MAAKSKKHGLVMCSYSELVPIGDLHEHPLNPNQHPEKQIALLANIIAKQGWRSPIVVSKRSGFIVSGHCRLMAARMLGCEKVPVDFQEFDSDAGEKAHLAADNAIADLAEFDKTKLKDLIVDIDDGQFDLLLTGYDQTDLSAMMTAVGGPVVQEDESAGKGKTKKCPECGAEF